MIVLSQLPSCSQAWPEVLVSSPALPSLWVTRGKSWCILQSQFADNCCFQTVLKRLQMSAVSQTDERDPLSPGTGAGVKHG
jgi:hypothetical protein